MLNAIATAVTSETTLLKFYTADGSGSLTYTDFVALRARCGLRLVPIADAADYRVWLWAPARMPLTIPPLTALTHAGVSVWHADMSPRSDGCVATNIAEYINDEQSRTRCQVDPRSLAGDYVTCAELSAYA